MTNDQFEKCNILQSFVKNIDDRNILFITISNNQKVFNTTNIFMKMYFFSIKYYNGTIYASSWAPRSVTNIHPL